MEDWSRVEIDVVRLQLLREYTEMVNAGPDELGIGLIIQAYDHDRAYQEMLTQLRVLEGQRRLIGLHWVFHVIALGAYGSMTWNNYSPFFPVAAGHQNTTVAEDSADTSGLSGEIYYV